MCTIIIICFFILNLQILWYRRLNDLARLHIINPEFTLNHWVIESLTVRRYKHLKFRESIAKLLYKTVPVYTLIMHMKKMHVSVCGPHLGWHKLLSCFNTFCLPVRWDHLQFMKSGFQIYEIKVVTMELNRENDFCL